MSALDLDEVARLLKDEAGTIFRPTLNADSARLGALIPELLRLARIGQEAERAKAEHAREGSAEMRRPGPVAEDLLRCAIAWEPTARLVGNVTAKELAMLVAHVIDTCPKCGSTAWVNIDCDLCGVCHAIQKEDDHG